MIIESKAFFETYSHSLYLLQEIREFNLSDLIVNHNHARNTTPDYLRDYEITSQINPAVAEWGFDSQQEKAFRLALSKRLTLIQGPPGTGKTYIGIAIATFILEHLKRKDIGPIILTCYTNHALD